MPLAGSRFAVSIVDVMIFFFIVVVVVKKINDVDFCDTFFERFEYREGLSQIFHLRSINQLSDDTTHFFQQFHPVL
jgi:hypothetical protein